jgi:hypothetical protein
MIQYVFGDDIIPFFIMALLFRRYLHGPPDDSDDDESDEGEGPGGVQCPQS